MDERGLRLVTACWMSGCYEETTRATTQEALAISPMWTISSMQNVNQRTPEQVKNLLQKRELGFRMWQSCIRLAWLQVELGGSFYIEQPQRCMTWRLQDKKTRYLLDQLSSYCIRDQCFDGLTHPKTGLPMQKGTRIQTNDAPFCHKICTEMHRP